MSIYQYTHAHTHTHTHTQTKTTKKNIYIDEYTLSTCLPPPTPRAGKPTA